MTNPIPGADSIADDAAFKDLLYQYSVTFVSDAEQDEGYASSNAKRDRLIAFIDSRAAAKVGANVAATKMLSGALNHARDTLRYYAEQEHFVRHQPDEWDTVSGEPGSLYEDSHNTATVEDGTLAKNTLNDIAGVEAYASIAAGAPAETPKPIVECPRYDFGCGRIESLWCDNCPERTTQPSPAPIAGDVEKDAARLTIEDCEHIFWLAARDIVFLCTYDEKVQDWTNGWHVAVNCNDTFYYASADATSFPPKQTAEIRKLIEQYGMAGAVAWCAKERNEMPLERLQSDKFKEAYAMLANSSSGEAR